MNNYQKSVRTRSRLLIFSVILTAALVLESCVFLVFASRPEGRYMHALNLGNRFLLSLDYSEAVRAFSEAIDIDPKKPEAYVGRGDAYAGLGQDDLARGDYEYAISLDSGYENELLPKIEELSPAAPASPEPELEPEPTEVPPPTETPAPTETPLPTNTPAPTEPPTPYEPPVNGTGGAHYGGIFRGQSGTEYSVNLYTSGEDPNNPGVVYTPDAPSQETAYEMWIVEQDVCRLDKWTGDRTLYMVFDTRDGQIVCRVYENGVLIDDCVRVRLPLAG